VIASSLLEWSLLLIRSSDATMYPMKHLSVPHKCKTLIMYQTSKDFEIILVYGILITSGTEKNHLKIPSTSIMEMHGISRLQR
jgi:hypothetical protein